MIAPSTRAGRGARPIRASIPRIVRRQPTGQLRYALSVRITYVLPQPEMNGGNKVIFQHVALLRAGGHEVTVLGEGPRPGWAGFDGPYHDRAAEPPRIPSQAL